ncbi:MULTISPECIES: PPOX class F420-dependent oxidoreductase [Amycolatopsis]|uniref:PPOX class probable F420-dependent enzyme n=1 Tax=Amycolatopsis thermoflava TaxID=84480 RepID=A0A3N2H5U5_9PSEU|nr:PPOX class F420-dependent oxidoreductase [Amycolatopsis thermoflava]ROS43475.1 PPOX class probable F420-dependent enzyme [Amycolatopsis thermoflava]
MTLPETVRRLVGEPHFAIVSTSNPDGRPQSSVVFVKCEDDGTIVFSTLRGRRKTRNLERDPRLSLLVVSRVTGHYAEVRGRVEITADPGKELPVVMYRLYMGGQEPPPEPGAERVVVRIFPEHVNLFPPAEVRQSA